MIAQLIGLIIILIVVIFSVFGATTRTERTASRHERVSSRPKLTAVSVSDKIAEPPVTPKSTSRRVTFAPQRRERIIDANGKITERVRSV